MAYAFEDIKDSITLITGGARGIGYSITKLFAAQGAKVGIIDINGDAVSKAVEEISKSGGQAFGKVCDITDYDMVDKVMQEIIDEFNQIDCLINNAGITKDGLFIRMKPDDWKKVIDINLTGTFNCSRVAINYMRKARKGSIINLASTSALGNPGQTNYSASKGGVVSFTAALGKEVAKMGIRVNAIAPGFIKTEMTDKMPDKIKNFVLSMVPLGRAGMPEEVAKVALFLSSDLASFITAKTYFVDGGLF